MQYQHENVGRALRSFIEMAFLLCGRFSDRYFIPLCNLDVSMNASGSDAWVDRLRVGLKVRRDVIEARQNLLHDLKHDKGKKKTYVGARP